MAVAAMKMIFVVAVLVALSITLTINIPKAVTEEDEYVPEIDDHESSPAAAASSSEGVIRVSRFLADNTGQNNKKKPNAAVENCRNKKDSEACNALEGRNGTVCCNNQCVDIKYNSNHCGGCRHKCKYTEVCCRGQCVDTAYDKRHCGKCNNRCPKGDFCVYGMCDYP